jgi:hypothetical protein
MGLGEAEHETVSSSLQWNHIRMPPPALAFDTRARLWICDRIIRTGAAPSVHDIARGLAVDVPATQAALKRLHDSHVLVLHESSGELLMVNPFSCVPTPFRVEAGNQSWWGNCIWDALGILAMLRQDGQVVTSCGCCNDPLTLTVRNGTLTAAMGIVHFALPASDWWKDIVFT